MVDVLIFGILSVVVSHTGSCHMNPYLFPLHFLYGLIKSISLQISILSQLEGFFTVSEHWIQRFFFRFLHCQIVYTVFFLYKISFHL